jgi:manganese/zinc/iron transport system ATP- binding protein
MNRQISELSGGEQQRAFLARSLLQNADIYFLDESLSGVDHASEEIIMDILRKMVKKHKTICMVHHDLNSADRYFDWMVLLNIRLVAAGPKEEVFSAQNLQEAYGKSFLLYDETIKLAQSHAAGQIV